MREEGIKTELGGLIKFLKSELELEKKQLGQQIESLSSELDKAREELVEETERRKDVEARFESAKVELERGIQY